MTIPDVQILLFEGFDELDAVAPYEVLAAAGFTVRLVVVAGDGDHEDGRADGADRDGMAARVGGDRDGRAADRDGLPAQITASHGLRVDVDGPFDPAAGGIALVPGGGWVSPDGGLRSAVRVGRIAPAVAAAHANGATVVSVCTGAVLLGAAGLLEDRPATTHAAGVEAVAGYGAQVRRDVRVVDDGDIVTCAGVTAALDLSLHLVARFAGEELARAGATRIEYDWRPEVVAT